MIRHHMVAITAAIVNGSTLFASLGFVIGCLIGSGFEK